ncbi:hypothetical protein [Bergeyella cardium]|uniref:Uncharacterized protein n=1 Tax=Bergeyella cardium TaxID=1585976 RepID=A0A6P1QW11_9FLAO|nr:hypothetical protein [Bergeyella cardium]QHN64874.1 hypothetical protein DBX24_02675 [Bergeyella cardium]WHE34183.1 hypothetical protein P8603_02695 [Bergeyella cardium]WHF60834.1 hypothetical protein O0R51_02690 [Bergeyella cardium]
MPHFWNNTDKVAVMVDELVPRFWSSQNILSKAISRNRKNIYGIKALQNGCRNRKLIIDFDSLPGDMQEALGDPRKLPHALLYYYNTDTVAVNFFTEFKRSDGHYLTADEQQRYITNASVLIAVLKLRAKSITERIKLGKSLKGMNTFLCEESNTFNDILQKRYDISHNLPTHPTRFKETLNAFETPFKYNGKEYEYNFMSIIKDVEGKRKHHRTKIKDDVNIVLNGLFAYQSHKPTYTEIHRAYETFLSGYAEITNEDTGEIYNPKDFPELSESTIKRFLSKWENKIGTYAVRSGNRQTYKGMFIPHEQMELPTLAGSLLSIDDRQPPFWYDKGKRLWFYIGLDVASDCITCFVYGKSKEGIILEFYRQLIRNYYQWGVELPYELECESSLNSSFTKTFLQNGYMFQNVRMEANNAQAKIIERRFGHLRNNIEKKAYGWIARPHAKSESNQAKTGKTPIIPYEDLVSARLADLEDWNNSPSRLDKSMSRFEYFLSKQKPDLPKTNYKLLLPYLGYKVKTSCNAGYINLQRQKRAIAENGVILTGNDLIEKMKMIEGKDIDVYWLDDNEGNVLKAMAFIGNRYICEVKEIPKYQRAKAEQTEKDLINKAIQDAYMMTVVRFAQRQTKNIEPINIINNTPPLKRVYQIQDLKRYEAQEIEEQEVEIIDEINQDDDDILYNPSTGLENVTRWRKSFQI